MKVYLASRYRRREELAKYREQLGTAGIGCTSWWLDGEENKDAASREMYARRDMHDIDDADVVVLFTENGPTERGGRHFEAGYGFAKGKKVFVVPYRENIFLELPEVLAFPTWEACLDTLCAISEDS